MSDLIRRDKALMCARPEYLNPNQEKLASYNQGWNNAVEMYYKQIAELPSAEPIQIETDREKLIKMTYCRGFNDGFEHAQEVISRFVKAVGYNIIIPKDLYDMEES